MDPAKTPVNIRLRGNGRPTASSFRVSMVCKRATIFGLFCRKEPSREAGIGDTSDALNKTRGTFAVMEK